MKRSIKSIIVGAFLVLGLGLTFVVAPEAFASPLTEACETTPNSPVCTDANGSNFNSVILIVVNTLLFIIGAIAVIMVIVGGIKYTTSGGDSGAITSAKNTILYSVIGLVVAFLAYAIVNWVIDAL